MLEYHCPLPTCDWIYQPPAESTAQVDPGFGRLVAEAVGLPDFATLATIHDHQNAKRTEHEVETHLNTHNAQEWALALAEAQTRPLIPQPDDTLALVMATSAMLTTLAIAGLPDIEPVTATALAEAAIRAIVPGEQPGDVAILVGQRLRAATLDLLHEATHAE
jgi:hypothetical protein